MRREKQEKKKEEGIKLNLSPKPKRIEFSVSEFLVRHNTQAQIN
jgi:hypothetical protein